uniref:F-box domain-containing protein n=1 Tax=Zea mays TaxID=4577 RepID=A0A804NL56_MAIZE
MLARRHAPPWFWRPLPSPPRRRAHGRQRALPCRRRGLPLPLSPAPTSSVVGQARQHRASRRAASLPSLLDDLLFSILLRIGSIRAAARTSVLSRRWRHVWARLPELRLGPCDAQPGATFLDFVDAVLDACTALIH